MPDATTLTPAEHLALITAKAQLGRQENPGISTTTVLVMAIERLTAPPEPSANCEACWHLWSLHGPDGCTAGSWTHSSLGPPPCPCEHTPPETQGATP